MQRAVYQKPQMDFIAKSYSGNQTSGVFTFGENKTKIKSLAARKNKFWIGFTF